MSGLNLLQSLPCKLGEVDRRMMRLIPGGLLHVLVSLMKLR
jgi:hypothetical protein